MSSCKDVKNLIEKMAGVYDLGNHMCFFGGVVPYLVSGNDSNREHADIDVLVDEDYMPVIRELIDSYGEYDPELDSLNFDCKRDYGIKTTLNGVYVEFEPMDIKKNELHRRSFSPHKKIVGEEVINFDNIEELIMPIKVGNSKTYSYTLEYMKVQKEKYMRDKDVKDIEVIDGIGIDEEKYNKVKTNFEKARVITKPYNVVVKENTDTKIR